MNYNIVTETSRNIRAIARESLQGKWKLAVIATAVYMIALEVPAIILNVIFGGETGVSALSGLYTILVAGPFTVGYSIFCLSLFRRKECEVAQVFYGFERFGKAIGLLLVMALFIMLWGILLVVPGIIAAFRYSQAFVIMIDHPEYGIMQCIAESKRIMTGNKMKLFCLQLSFLGWLILSNIPVVIVSRVLGEVGVIANVASLFAEVGSLWLTPYMYVAFVAFYELANGNLMPGVIEVDPMVLNNENVKFNEDSYNTEGEVHTTEEVHTAEEETKEN